MAQTDKPRKGHTASAKLPPAGDTAKKAVTSTAAISVSRRPAPPPEPPRDERPFKVRATQIGFYDNARRRPGDVFTIQRHSEFSIRWMERVDASTPDKITTPNESIRQQHDEILALRHAGQVPAGSVQTGPDNVPDNLPTGTHNPLGDE